MANRPGPMKGNQKLKIASSPVNLSVVTDQTAAGAVQPAEPYQPAGMPEELEEIWDEVVPQLVDAGLVSRADGPAIEASLMHFAIMRKAFRELMDADMAVPDTAHGDADNPPLKKHPAEVVLRSHSTHFMQYADRLGMTFVSRARTPAPKEGSGGTERNPFAATGS